MLLCFERLDAILETCDPLAAVGGREASFLEGGEVAVERAPGAGEFLCDRRASGLRLLRVTGVVVCQIRECVADERGVRIQLDHLGDDGVFERGLGEPIPVAELGSVAVALGADVVVVEAASSACGGADVRALAPATADKSGEQVVGAVSAFERLGLAAFGQDLLRLEERRVVHERLVQAGDLDVAELDPSEVDGILQDGEHGGPREGRAVLGPSSFGVEDLSDRLGAEPVVGVVGEHAPDDVGLCGLGVDQLRGLVASVAVGNLADDPAALGCGAFHAGGDALDDGGALVMPRRLLCRLDGRLDASGLLGAVEGAVGSA